MLYVQDRMNKTLAVIDNYYNDEHTMILESGVSTYNFTISKNQEGAEYLIRGNYIVLTDEKGIGWKFTIMATDETHNQLNVECEDLGLELLNKVRNSWASPGTAQPFKYYFDKALRDTGWTLGINEISGLSRALQWDGRDTALKRLLSICTQFDHAEIEFKIEFRNMSVVKQVVNVYKKRGVERSDVQLVYGDTVNDIRKTTEIRELATAIQGVGGVIQKDNPVEGEPEEHVDFSSLTYDDGEYFTPVGDPFLYARIANKQFNIRDTYLEDFYDYDTQDAQELLNRTLTQLKDRCQPKINYEVDLAKVDSSLNLGDTVTIIDHDYKPELLLSGRVLQLEKSYTDSSKNKATFGNFLILYSNISDELRALQEQMNSLKPVANYMWIRYAEDDKGKGMTAMPTADTKYFAMLVNKKTGVPSDNPADYAGHWKLIQGEDGKDGIPGPKGEDGKTSYTHIAYANNVSGTADFSLDDPTGRSYMGVYSDFTKADSTNPSDYVWSYTKGETGPEGKDGAQGIPGKPGADGKTSYTHIAYTNIKFLCKENQDFTLAKTSLVRYGSDSRWVYKELQAGAYTATTTLWGQGDPAQGATKNVELVSEFSTSDYVDKTHIGVYVDFVEADSADPSKYAWSLIKGADGANGTPGAKGADGKTPYFHQAWADSKDGKINFSTTDPTNRGYLGTYSDFTQADSTDPTKYFWVELVGNLQVGGRNYIINSSGFSASDTNRASVKPNYTTSAFCNSAISYNNDSITLTYTGTGTQEWYYAVAEAFRTYDSVGLDKTKQYTISVEAMGTVPGAAFRINNVFSPSVSLSNEKWTKLKYTFKFPDIGGQFYIRLNAFAGNFIQGQTLSFRNFKLEEGNVATDWSPAPEDTQGQIDTINKGLADTNSKIAAVTKIDRQSTAPTNPKKGDQWWVLSKDPTTGKDAIEAFKQWNGTQWEDAPIQQSAMNIGTLNGNVINGATINGSEFTNNFDYTGPDKIHYKGVTEIKDGAIDSAWKIPENNQTGYSKMNASGFDSIVNNPDGTIIKQARLGMGELYLSGNGVMGWIDEQDSYRNTGIPTYLNNWGVWNQATQVRITRNGRQVTISGYIKHYGGTVSPIIQVPAWAYPANPTEIISGASFDEGVGNSKACNLSLGRDGLLANNAGVQVNGYLSFSASYTSVDIK